MKLNRTRKGARLMLLLLMLALLTCHQVTRAQETIISDATVPLLLTTTTTATQAPTTQASSASQPPEVAAVGGGSTPPEVATAAPDEAPQTSTVDSVAVNLDEASASSVVAGGEEGATTTVAPSSNAKVILSEPTTTTSGDADAGEDGAAAPQLEAKSIDASQEAGGSERPRSPRRFPKRLNLTHIDQVYASARRSEPEVVRSWQEMGKKMKRGIGQVISSMIPMALNMSQEARIGSNCTGAMLKWVLSMNSLKLWALKMLDASGKPIAGLLEGSMTMFGNHRQCLAIRAPDDDEIEFTGAFQEFFRGKYCVIQAKPWLPDKSRFYNFNTKIRALVENNDEAPWYDKTALDELTEWALAFNFVNLRMDLCMPSLCSREDIQKAINFITDGLDMKIRVLRCEVASHEQPGSVRIESSDPSSSSSSSLISESSSDLQDWPLSAAGWLLAPFLVIGLVLLASVVSLTLPRELGEDAEPAYLDKTKNKLRHTIDSLSLKRSLGSHLNVDYALLADDKPLALYGVRFLLVLWVIGVESAVNLRFEFLRELLVLKELIFWWPLQVIINSTLQYDSFILLAAFTMAYRNCLNQSLSTGRALLKYLVDKYVRLMPSVMLLVACTILLPRLYSGPVWNDYVLKQARLCHSNGWLNALFLQNYLPYKEICLPHTWLLCVELQLVVLMAPLVYYLNRCYMSTLAKQAAASSGGGGGGGGGATSGEQVSHSYKLQAKPAPNKPLGNRQDATRALHWLFTLPGLALCLCVAAGWLASFWSVYANHLPPLWLYTMPDPDSKSLYFSDHLTRLWAHLAVFAVGLLGGLECRRVANERAAAAAGRRNSSPLLDRKLNGASSQLSIDMGLGPLASQAAAPAANCCALLRHLLCAGLAITTMALIIFSTHHWSVHDLPGPLTAALFDATSRLLWSGALLWLLYTVSVPPSSGAAQPMAWPARLLGSPLLVHLGKLSFLIYLIYPMVHLLVLAIQEQPVYSSWLMLFHVLAGNLTLSCLLASLVSLFLELPCRNLFRRCETSLLLAHPVPVGPGPGRAR